MIKIQNGDRLAAEQIIARSAPSASAQIDAAVSEIIGQVRLRGDAALLDYTEKFDGKRPDSLAVSAEEIDAAFEKVDKKLLEAMKTAAENITRYHTCQKREGFELRGEGMTLGQRILPLGQAGIYVPGGTARYPSTVLMSAIPAKIAGVRRIAMVTPPDRSGNIEPAVLAAAKIAGVTEIYRVGGAQAIAALAYGTQSIKKVDKIVGPGNAYVAAAKKAVFGQVSIDMIAGPSEILIIADKTANPRFIAADMLSQAEHDRLAAAVLVTTDMGIAKQVDAELEKQLPLLSRNETAAASIASNGRIIAVGSLERAAQISDLIAPEHLELCVEKPFELMEQIGNAGSIFLGSYSPEPLGDYMAGPNHTLPTMGTARFSSPLSVDDFIKKNSFVCCEKSALGELKDKITVFADAEGLTAHAASVKVRFEAEK